MRKGGVKGRTAFSLSLGVPSQFLFHSRSDPHTQEGGPSLTENQGVTGSTANDIHCIAVLERRMKSSSQLGHLTKLRL